ncbi:MAG: rhodanese-like domain-containing protein [Eudoraea sp.]|nr:rhodanese-like domain-containing protein [Eudoraea sp.]
MNRRQCSIFVCMLKGGIFYGMLLMALPVFGQRTLEKIMEKLAYKDVPLATVTEAAVNPSYYRLDTREPEEFEVSHLKDAHLIGYSDFNTSEFAENFPDKDATYLVYCSVGVRSEKIGKKLMAMGYTDVKNLSGGMFKWVNEGYDIVDQNGRETQKIHAYNRFWGLLLNRGEKVYGPEKQE